MVNIHDLKISLRIDNVSNEPLPDIAICSICGGVHDVDKLEINNEYDFETNINCTYHVCPLCLNGGCIDNYKMTPLRASEWNNWNTKRNAIMFSLFELTSESYISILQI